MKTRRHKLHRKKRRREVIKRNRDQKSSNSYYINLKQTNKPPHCKRQRDQMGSEIVKTTDGKRDHPAGVTRIKKNTVSKKRNVDRP